MKIVIEGKPKEIADFVIEVQNQRLSNLDFGNSIYSFCKEQNKKLAKKRKQATFD